MGIFENLESPVTGDLFPSLANIGDLVPFLFSLSVGPDKLNRLEEYKPYYLPLSYPNGKCFGIEFKRDNSIIPLELGISLNKTFMTLNNISDLDIYFKDPLNSVGFLSPKIIYIF